MITLRYYQEEAVTSIFDYFASGAPGNPVVALPTGTGKSIVIAEAIRRALMWYPQTRILVVTHVKELIQQNFDELMSLWPTAPAGIYSAGLKRRDVNSAVTFCGIGSIAKRAATFGHIDLIFVDECHTVSPKDSTMYNKAFTALKAINPNVRVIGLSASPYRLGTGMITDGGLFTDICCDYCTLEKFNKLVEDGFISPLIPRQTETELDVSNVETSGGDYVLSQLQSAVDNDSTTRAALTEAVRLSAGRVSWLVFTTGVDHTRHVVDILNELGIPARAVHSQMEEGLDKGTREENIELFKKGYIGALVNYGVLTTGFNHKPVDNIVMLRPTKSPGLWVQMLGRGTRPYDYRTERNPALAAAFPNYKVNCQVLDFAANTTRLGPINDPVIPTKKKKKGKGDAPFKVCPVCAVYNHARARFCINCQAEFPESTCNLSTTAGTDELIRKAPKPPPPPVREETFVVNRMEGSRHNSKDPSKPPSLKLTFCCGLHLFTEYLSLEHPDRYPRHLARDKWRTLAQVDNDVEPPDTADMAVDMIQYLTAPSRIRVLMQKPYPQVVGYEFGPPPLIL
jgi:DNA repair protein RadD